MILQYSDRKRAADSPTHSNEMNIALLEEAVTNYGKQMTNLAYTYVKDWSLAEDIIQEVFIKALRNMNKFRGQSSLKTWLYSITANHCKDYLRSSYFRRVVLSNVFPLRHKDEEKVNGENHNLSTYVIKLPVKYREVIILHYYEDLKIREISELLEVNEATIKSRLQRARKILKNKLGEEGEV